MWIIVNDDGDFWSNDLGWTEYFSLATLFTSKERYTFSYLPIGGNSRWELAL